jgi:hypothetical protein
VTHGIRTFIINPFTQSPITTRGGSTPFIKHSTFIDSYIKPMDSADLDGQNEKATSVVALSPGRPIRVSNHKPGLVIGVVTGLARRV